MTRRLAAPLLALIVSALVVPTGVDTAPAAALNAPTITVLDSLVDVRPGLAVPAGGTGASVVTARNEFESFQIVVEASSAIDNLNVDLAGPLTGDVAGSSLGVDHVTFYREGFHTVVSNATIDTRSDGESAAGRWPDVLIPEKDYIFNKDRAAFHESVPAGGRVVVWVDVLAPLGQAPGHYSGTIRIKDGATTLATVPVGVDVRTFAIPSTSSLRNQFLTDFRTICPPFVSGTVHPRVRLRLPVRPGAGDAAVRAVRPGRSREPDDPGQPVADRQVPEPRPELLRP